MENQEERDYGQDDHNSKNGQDSIQLGTSDNRSVANEENSAGGSKANPENADDANKSGFNSGTNPDRYDSVSNNSGPSTFQNGEKKERNSNNDVENPDGSTDDANVIPGSEDIEDDDSEEDFDTYETDDDAGNEDDDNTENNSNQEKRTPGL